MSPIVLSVTIVAYFAILFTISYIAGHKVDNEGFFVGNHKSAWYIVAFAMIGSTISGVTFVSVPGMVQASSFSYLQMVLGFIVGQIIIAFVLVPLFYRMNLVSIYEYLENRFGSSSYKTGAWFFFISKFSTPALATILISLVTRSSNFCVSSNDREAPLLSILNFNNSCNEDCSFSCLISC